MSDDADILLLEDFFSHPGRVKKWVSVLKKTEEVTVVLQVHEATVVEQTGEAVAVVPYKAW